MSNHLAPGAPVSDLVDGFVEAGATLFHVRRSGSPGPLPTIVLECGAGSIAAHWCWIQADLAAHTQVISYDRAGMGRSRPVPADAGVEATTARLQALIRALEIRGPYILAGHSMGGLYARYAAANHWPGLVGIVLVDSTISGEVPFPLWHRILLPTLSIGFALASKVGLLKLLNALFHRPGRSGLPPEVEAEALTLGVDHAKAARQEAAALEALRHAVGNRPLDPAVPVLAITAGNRGGRKRGDGQPPPLSAFNRVFMRQHEELAAASQCGRQVLMPQATHGSLLTNHDHAAEVAREILAFAERVAARSA